MQKESPEISYVLAEEDSNTEDCVNRAFDLILDHLLEQYRRKKLEDNNK